MENNEKNNSVEDTQKSRRVGTLTFGIMLILFGVVMLVQLFIKTEIFRYILMLWPIIFISLGIETIYCSIKKDIKIKYDIWSVILTFAVLGFGLVFGVINYGVNEFLYNSEVRKALTESIQDNKYTCAFDENVEIKNLSQKDIDFSVVTDENFTGVKVEISAKYEQYSILGNWIIANNSWIYENLEIGNNTLIIKDVPDYIDSIKIIVYTDDANKVNYIK